MPEQHAKQDPTTPVEGPRHVLVLSTSRTSLTTQTAKRLEREGYRVTRADVKAEIAAARAATRKVVSAEEAADRLVKRHNPKLVVCPYMTTRIPASVHEKYRTLIFHPGPPGDRGPSSLDYAIIDGKLRWGGIVIAATHDPMDEGPLYASGLLEVPPGATKSSLYNGLMAALALDLIVEAVAKAFDQSFVPIPFADGPRPDPTATKRPLLKKEARRDAFSWGQSADEVLRRIRAGDGSPGQPTALCGQAVRVFDAHGPKEWKYGTPGEVVAIRDEAVLVCVGGDQAVWIGQVRLDELGAIKLPTTIALGEHLPRLRALPSLQTWTPGEHSEILYWELNGVGYLMLTHYNGAMSPPQAERATAALRAAKARPTKVLVLLGNSTGINLCTIAARPTPAERGNEAYSSIKAINRFVREILTPKPGQLIIYAFTGSAAAGGAHLAWGAPLVLAPNGPGLLSLSYIGMGLTGSEFHSRTLPERVGKQRASILLMPDSDVVDFVEAKELGLVDELGPGDPSSYMEWVVARASALTDGADRKQLLRRQVCWSNDDLDATEAAELYQMRLDMQGDRYGFLAFCGAFATKAAYSETPDQTRARLRTYEEELSNLLVSSPN